MRILGIDPGFAITGYSIIDYIGNKFNLITSGAVTTKAGESFPLRLLKLNNDLENIIDEYKPDAISVEELFFNNNAKTAINVAQARGVILVVGSRKQVPTYEYTPLQIKQAVVGYGRADKMQVQKMVKTILNVEKLPKLDDTTRMPRMQNGTLTQPNIGTTARVAVKNSMKGRTRSGIGRSPLNPRWELPAKRSANAPSADSRKTRP